MKNWGKFFILIMTLLMLSACGEKGGSGGTTTTVSITTNDKMASLVRTNRESINSLVKEFPEDDYLYSIVNSLYEIILIYSDGGKLSDLTSSDSEIDTNISKFFLYGAGKNWMTYDEYLELYNAITEYISSEGPGDEDTDIARKIGGRLNDYHITSIDKAVALQENTNVRGLSHYVNLLDIYYAEDFLDQTISIEYEEYPNRSETIRNFLKSKNLIFDGDRVTIYNNRISVLKYEKEVLEKGSSTDVVISTGILSETAQSQLVTVINDLISQYSSYELSIDHTNFNGYDTLYYNNMVSGTSGDPTDGILDIGGAKTGTASYVNHPEVLATDVGAVISKLKSSLESLDITSTYYSQIQNVLAQMEGDTYKSRNPYDRLIAYGSLSESSNEAIVFSKAIPTAELIQIISENKALIKRWGI